MVIFDGEKLIVSLNKRNYRGVLELGKVVDEFEYLPTINSAILPPTKNVAKKLLELGCYFDESAQIFLTNSKPEMDFKSIDKKFEAYPFQKEGVKIMLNSPGNVLLADEMGLGKTVQGALYLRYKKDSLPALIISPASLKENWKKEIKTWTGKDAYVIEGRTPEKISKEFLAKYPVLIINYDILGQDNKDDKKYQNELKIKIKKLKERVLLVRENEKKQKLNEKIYMYQSVKRNFKVRVEGWCDILSQLNFKTIIGDEIQYISGIDTIRTRATQKIAFAIPDSKKIFISGTPYETKTLQFFPCLNILDNEHFKNEYKYKMKFCDPEKTRFGWKFEGLSNAEELHRIISQFMIRRLKKDVLKDLPPKMRSVIPMKIKPSDRKMYDKIDGELALAIINKEKNALSKLEALKQASFQAKKDSMIQWIKDYLEINEKLVVFIWHRESCEILEKEFEGVCVSITGSTPAKDRQKIVERFQSDSGVKLFIGQIKSAGVGLTLTKSKAVAFLEFGSTAPGMEQAEDRVHRIGQEADSVLAYYLTMENSIDEQIMKVLNRRNKDLKKVMDNKDEELFAPEKELEFSKMILNEYIQDKKLK